MTYSPLVLGLGTALLVAGLSVGVQTVRLSSAQNTLTVERAERATEREQAASAALAAQQQIGRQAAATQQAVAAADERATREIDDAKKRLQTDRAALADDALRVRLNGAKCAHAGDGAVPVAARASGVADGAAGGLPAPVAATVLDLRWAIERDAAQIMGLQDYVRALSAH